MKSITTNAGEQYVILGSMTQQQKSFAALCSRTFTLHTSISEKTIDDLYAFVAYVGETAPTVKHKEIIRSMLIILFYYLFYVLYLF